MQSYFLVPNQVWMMFRGEVEQVTWRTVTMETRAEFGMEADPMAASVAVMAITTTFPGDTTSPFACINNQK